MNMNVESRRPAAVVFGIGMVCIVASLLSGCSGAQGVAGNNGVDGAQGPAGSAASPAPVSDEQALVNSLVASENENRENLGQTELSNGLSCTLYTITGGAYINATSQAGASQSPTLTGLSTAATFTLNQSFNQPNSSVSAGLNVLPTALQGLPKYQNLIELVCSGQIVVTHDGYYDYSITSDDDGLVYIDGAFVLDDDGEHGAQTVSNTRYMRSGVHTFTLKFAQTGAGSQALVFSSNGSVVDPMYFYH